MKFGLASELLPQICIDMWQVVTAACDICHYK
jgi:hypothetical protein